MAAPGKRNVSCPWRCLLRVSGALLYAGIQTQPQVLLVLQWTPFSTHASACAAIPTFVQHTSLSVQLFVQLCVITTLAWPCGLYTCNFDRTRVFSPIPCTCPGCCFWALECPGYAPVVWATKRSSCALKQFMVWLTIVTLLQRR